MTEQKKKLTFEKPEMSIEELSKALFVANQNLDALNKQLIAHAKERSDFYANISHDLRSPVSAISSSIEYLLTKDHVSDVELHSILNMMKNRTASLEQMINDIFTLSALNSTNYPLHMEELDMGIFLEEFFYESAADSQYNGRILRLQVPMELSCMCRIDPILIKRVLDNLFTNALKYSAKGDSIILGAKILNLTTLLVSVKDTGIGIPSDQLDKIFNRSYRIDKARTRGNKPVSGSVWLLLVPSLTSTMDESGVKVHWAKGLLFISNCQLLRVQFDETNVLLYNNSTLPGN